ncbi:sigma-70 family RNA polymerase sigma factor [Pedobacter sp. SD-b]|uniref:Sigma-70 family RNA polymerase sigma factor n=1 Tax=Pedobacter segetis TaxID=2793069 RepID=A0ABS1BHT7_9SPHI|nr:sigma-70 family RNA polymerase sigma factor [Pedobacter segetis]MBK0382377.1 sigma-70 family RNA polymerase sigma factor [Pedobacter segetis]
MSSKTNYFKPTDNEIILGILNNSSSTLQYLYKAYFPMVYQLIVNNSGSEDDAKDVYQEGIIILHDKIKSGDFELTSKLKTFLYSVCRRLWLKRLNHKSRYNENINDYEDHFSVEQDLVSHEEKDQQFVMMDSALQQLGEPCKTIIEDFYIHNKSMQDISEKFGYTNADNAKTQKYKCLQRLKKLFFSKENI